jgi:hypothetical protein
MAVTIVPSTLRQQVEEGWKLKALAEHYGLPDAQMKKALKALNLTIRKFHNPKFVFAEEQTTGQEVIEDTIAMEAEEINHVVETENTVEENVETPIEEINTTTVQPAVSQMGDW